MLCGRWMIIQETQTNLYFRLDNESNAGVAKPGKAPDLRSGYLRVSRVRIPSPALIHITILLVRDVRNS